MKLSVSYYPIIRQWLLILLCNLFLAVNATAGQFAELVAIEETPEVHPMAQQPVGADGNIQSVSRLVNKGILVFEYDSSQTKSDAAHDAGLPKLRSILSDIGAYDDNAKPKHSYLGKLGKRIFDLAQQKDLDSVKELGGIDCGNFSNHIGKHLTFIPLMYAQTHLPEGAGEIVQAYLEKDAVTVVTIDGKCHCFELGGAMDAEEDNL